MDERLAAADSDRTASSNEPNGYDLIAGLLEFTAAAVIGYGYYRFFFPPPNVRSYGAMELIAPMMLASLLASIAFVVALGGRYRTGHWIACGVVILVCALGFLVDFVELFR